MSSGVESDGVIAAAVMLPVGLTVGAALGAGWLPICWDGLQIKALFSPKMDE